MVDFKDSYHPAISYRTIRPSDLEVLEKLHYDVFPIRYESEFFHNVVNGCGIVSWGAVDHSRLNGESNELIGFVTARVIPAKDSEIEDLCRFDPSKPDQTLVYILTLGVVESYRKLGIATSLIQKVITYASSIPACLAVYLHVIYYNYAAIHLYQKMSFHCARWLPSFYFINGEHYDSFLFIYYINEGRSRCSPFDVVTLVATYVRSGLKLIGAKLWKNGGKISRWYKNGREMRCLIATPQSKRIHMTEGIGYQ